MAAGQGAAAATKNHPPLCQACVPSPGHPAGGLKAGLGFGGLAASHGSALTQIKTHAPGLRWGKKNQLVATED